MKRRTLASVVFVLNMACLVTGASSAVAQSAPIVPPAPVELQNRATNIVVRLSSEGIPSINNQTVPWERLASELKAIFAQRPEKILFIQTTQQNRIEDIRRIMAVAKKHGIVLYALLAVRRPT